jgi:SAM-dependent methyltransferase
MRLKSLRSKFSIIYEKYLIKIEKGFLLRYNFFYKIYLKLVKGLKFNVSLISKVPWLNTNLKTKDELSLAIKIIEKSNLKLHPNIPEKNWDSLIALNAITQNTDKSAIILDAGGEKSSLILFWLYQLGYSNLKCLNLTFNKRIKRGDIEFIPGDLTKTLFPNNYFDAITCISVIEHGVDEVKYFKEMYRILKKGGLLLTSMDYWENEIDRMGGLAYNNPIYVYNKNSIRNLLEKALKQGFILFGPEIDLNCQNKVVKWEKFNLDFTFLIFSLQKP